MRTVGFIAENMSRHGELSSGCFYLMGNEEVSEMSLLMDLFWEALSLMAIILSG